MKFFNLKQFFERENIEKENTRYWFGAKLTIPMIILLATLYKLKLNCKIDYIIDLSKNQWLFWAELVFTIQSTTICPCLIQSSF